MTDQRHDPTYTSARGTRYVDCSCGWVRGPFSSPTGAQLAFGEHLVTNKPKVKR